MTDDDSPARIKKGDMYETYHDGRFKRLPTLQVLARDEQQLRNIASHIADEFGETVFAMGEKESSIRDKLDRPDILLKVTSTDDCAFLDDEPIYLFKIKRMYITVWADNIERPNEVRCKHHPNSEEIDEILAKCDVEVIKFDHLPDALLEHIKKRVGPHD